MTNEVKLYRFEKRHPWVVPMIDKEVGSQLPEIQLKYGKRLLNEIRTKHDGKKRKNIGEIVMNMFKGDK
jgi:hypothetical protein